VHKSRVRFIEVPVLESNVAPVRYMRGKCATALFSTTHIPNPNPHHHVASIRIYGMAFSDDVIRVSQPHVDHHTEWALWGHCHPSEITDLDDVITLENKIECMILCMHLSCPSDQKRYLHEKVATRPSIFNSIVTKTRGAPDVYEMNIYNNHSPPRTTSL
jgi:hypothetical protein